MNFDEIKHIIKAISFVPVDGANDVYTKKYPDIKYHIDVDFKQDSIIYPDPLIVNDKTTSHLKNAENIVVLECVNRLLEQGYLPKCIELERKFKLGHKNSGRLDINVNDADKKAYLMIECKTSGAEFEKEIKNMSKNGGQLFSYFQQDKNAQYLCLYASKLKSGRIEYQNKIIECSEALSEAKEVKDIFKIWNKQFKENGLFENGIPAYDFKPVALRIKDLQSLQEDDSGKIFNGFMEILRHNVISDKPNAFNKIFNLFLCKLQDEKGLADEEVGFQWREDDNYISFLMRINELYAKGVKDYLDKNITNLTEADINKLVANLNNNEAKDQIREAILYKNNEFAFSDVYDERSFTQNAIIVREIVELLQPYKIRYAHKQQFLGDFFELLLNTGFKQESGQFFTPVPLARFIINSLPFKEIIQEKLDNKEKDFLPYVIDYAMGTGHFITEAMDEIQEIINSKSLEPKDQNSTADIENFASNNSQFKWAEKYVYGIERDYRLVKTAKVACFLHGDGLANIIHGDGLDSFKTSEDYKGILKGKYKDNQQFDVLIANPPYSVSAFKHTLPNGDESFDLYNHLTDQSSEIECLFIERTKQLVKTSGYAAIILPSSILSNGGIYAKAREILLRHFEIYAISEFGSNTFMATGTNTVVLFMKRRDDGLFHEIKQIVLKFMADFQDVTCNRLEKAFSTYAQSVYEIGFDDYVLLLQGKEIDHDIFRDYQKANKSLSLEECIQEKEREKLIFFILNAHVNTVVTKSGEKKVEKDFLGYEFSNRRGSEGIKIYKNADGSFANKLYNADNRHDEERVSHYIYKNGLGKSEFNIPDNLGKHLEVVPLCDLVNFDIVDCEKSIYLNVKKNFEIRKSKYPLFKINDLIDLDYLVAKKGTNITNSKADISGNIPVIAGGKTSPYNHNMYNVEEPCFTISASGANAGYIWFHQKPIWASDCTFLHSRKKEKLLTRFLYELFKVEENNIKNVASGNAQPHVYLKNLSGMKLPLPPIDVQNHIVKRIEEIDSKQKNAGGDLWNVLEEQKLAIINEVWED